MARYMLLMSGLRANLEAFESRIDPADLAAHLACIHAITRDLEASRELVVFEELTLPAHARLVRGGAAADPGIGFAETKEFVGAFWLVECASEQRALAIANRLSLAPLRGGAPGNVAVEVRPVLTASS